MKRALPRELTTPAGADPAAADAELARSHADAPHPRVLPIPFPDSALCELARARCGAGPADNERFGERQRQAAAITAAQQNGHDHGHRAGWAEGYKIGVTWGIFCGACATVLFGALLIVGAVLVIGLRHAP